MELVDDGWKKKVMLSKEGIVQKLHQVMVRVIGRLQQGELVLTVLGKCSVGQGGECARNGQEGRVAVGHVVVLCMAMIHVT